MLVIADASPCVICSSLAKADLLPVLFGEIWVPPVVIGELSATATPDVVRRTIQTRPSWLRIREPGIRSVAAVSAGIDAGEPAALAPAIELNADLVLIGDDAGRNVARTHGIRITGTIGVLRLAAERDLIDVRSTLDDLRRARFYIHESVIQSAFGPWLEN